MGGKGGPVATNDQLVQMQQQQAAQAANANIQTQARLNYGVNQINDIFQGVPSGSTMLDLSSIANAPSGKLAGGYSWGVAPDTGGATSYALYDPSGNMVTDANSLQQLSQSQIYTGGDPNNLTGGFGPDFYNNYRNSIMNYYLPQEDQQYQNARSSLNYSLARAGQLQSGVAGMDIGNLAQQDTMNQAQIASQADQQEASLRNQIQQDQTTALNQLYSTENPTVAANTAQNMVANANLTKPVLDPVGQLFSNISVGVGNAISGFTNPYAYINPSAGGMGQLATPGTGATAGGSSSSGISGSTS